MAKKRKEPRQDELLAEQIVNGVLGTSTVERDDNSRPGMVDALLDPGNSSGPLAALEVSSTTDRAAAMLWSVVDKEHGDTVHPELSWCWLISYQPHARAGGEAARRLVSYLAELEARGVREVRRTQGFVPFVTADGVTAGDHAELARLGLLAVSAVPDTERSQGRIYHYSVAVGEGFGPADPVPGYVDDFLASETGVNKLRKLERQAKLGRRTHLFLWAEPHHVHIGQPLSNAVLPTQRPAPPVFLDSIWLASAFAPEHVYRWTPQSGWEVVTVPVPGLDQDDAQAPGHGT